MRLLAYAKINPALFITGVREDGMHMLDMLMQTVTLADELSVVKTEGGVTLSSPGLPADRRNTAYRAAELFFAETGAHGGADIAIEKHIPAKAGLGGGSSDAAAVINALNLLYETGLAPAELERIGGKIGADVPFFIRGGGQRARGTGDRLTPYRDGCRFSYLLIKPEGGVSTAEAYTLADRLPRGIVDVNAAQKGLMTGWRAAYYAAAGNSLTAAGEKLCPEIAELRRDCAEQGADFSLMTGSGSCVFAVFSDPAARMKALAYFSERVPFCAEAENAPAGFERV